MICVCVCRIVMCLSLFSPPPTLHPHTLGKSSGGGLVRPVHPLAIPRADLHPTQRAVAAREAVLSFRSEFAPRRADACAPCCRNSPTLSTARYPAPPPTPPLPHGSPLPFPCPRLLTRFPPFPPPSFSACEVWICGSSSACTSLCTQRNHYSLALRDSMVVSGDSAGFVMVWDFMADLTTPASLSDDDRIDPTHPGGGGTA